MAYLMAVRSFLLALVALAVVPSHAQAQCNTTLLQAIMETPALSHLAMVIERAGLTNRINATDNVTVLAPNNAAFNGTDGLLQILQQNHLTLDQVTEKDSNRAASIILYHIIPTPATAAQLVNGQTLPTELEGRSLTVSKTTPTPTTTSVTFTGAANNATVQTADIRVCNSVVHVVNRVLLPNATLTGIPIYNADAPAPGVGAASSLAIATWAFALSGALATTLSM